MKAKGIFYDPKGEVFYFTVEQCDETVLGMKMHLKLTYGTNTLIDFKNSKATVEHTNEVKLREAREYVRSLG